MIRTLFSKIARRLRVYNALSNASRDSIQRLKVLPAKNLLILCYGNIYRSPFVEQVLVDQLPERYSVKSTGFHSVSHRKSPPNHIKMAEEYGVNLSSHRSTNISQELVDWADIIVLMDRHNWDKLQSYGSLAVSKAVWLGAFTDSRNNEIEDPYGKSDLEQRKILSQLHQASEKLIKILKQ